MLNVRMVSTGGFWGPSKPSTMIFPHFALGVQIEEMLNNE